MSRIKITAERNLERIAFKISYPDMYYDVCKMELDENNISYEGKTNEEIVELYDSLIEIIPEE